ncbi:MAG: hypothetical protein NXI10_14365 [bacterium]|nr:hypothetical protein [bacterium]
MLNSNAKILCILTSLLLSVSTYAFEEEGDSTASKIEFNEMEATLSARIIHFRWSVASEELGDHFLIQKSLDQKNWTQVTKVSSIKSHKEQHTYEISEIDFAEGVHEYFRILRVDANGETTEMDRVNINRPVLTNMLLIPVPRKVNKEMTLSYDSMIASEGMLTVMSKSGEIVEEFEVLISEGYNRFKLYIKNYEKGEYLVTIRDQYENKVSKRLVVR